MIAGCDKYEVREIVDSSLSKLKDWLDMRLRQQEELLRCFGNSRESDGCLPGSERNGHVKDSIRQAANADESVSHITPVTECTDVNNIFYRVSDHPLEDAEFRMIKTAVMDTSDAQSDGSLEEVPLPGTIGTSDTSAQRKNTSTSAAADIQDSRAQLPDEMHVMPDGKEKRASVTDLHIQDLQCKLMDLFDHLDMDGSGAIDTTEFRKAFEDVGMPEVQGLYVFKAVDTSQNGFIDRIEWLNIAEETSMGAEKDVDLLNEFLDRLAERQANMGAAYDSNHHAKGPTCMLRHDSFWRMAWDMCLMLTLFYVSVSVPFSIGLGQSDILDTLDRMTDIFFCCDLLLNFRTSYLDHEETVIFDSKKIACRYLRTWFALDFVSSVPFDLVTAGMIPNLTPARLMKIGKIAKVIKLLRLSKVMLLAESELLEVLDKKLGGRSHITFVRIAKLAAITFLLAHWLACFGNAVDKASLDNYFADLEGGPSELQRYLAAMYWAMTTLSTVGYGDITPKTDAERAYAMMAMMVGGSLYGYVIGCVTSIVTETDINSHAFRERMELFQAWLGRHQNIPRVLRVRLKRHYERALASKAAMDDAQVVVELSPELRAESSFFLIDDHVRCHPMFSDIPNSALAKLVEVLQKSHVSTKEYIVRSGDPGIAMYILVNGTARYDKGIKWQPPDVETQGKRFARVMEGDSFGEEIIFGLAETYAYTIVTISDCEFHAISEDGFQERYQNMPELRVQMYSSFLKSRGMRTETVPAPEDLAERCRTLRYSQNVRQLITSMSSRETVPNTFLPES